MQYGLFSRLSANKGILRGPSVMRGKSERQTEGKSMRDRGNDNVWRTIEKIIVR